MLPAEGRREGGREGGEAALRREMECQADASVNGTVRN